MKTRCQLIISVNVALFPLLPFTLHWMYSYRTYCRDAIDSTTLISLSRPMSERHWGAYMQDLLLVGRFV